MTNAMRIASRKTTPTDAISLLVEDQDVDILLAHPTERTVGEFELFKTLETDPFIISTLMQKLMTKCRFTGDNLFARRNGTWMISLYSNFRALGRLEFDPTYFKLVRHEWTNSDGSLYVEYTGSCIVRSNITCQALPLLGAELPRYFYPSGKAQEATFKWLKPLGSV